MFFVLSLLIHEAECIMYVYGKFNPFFFSGGISYSKFSCLH